MRRIIKSFIISSIIGLYCNPIMASALEYFDYDFENGSTFIYKIVDDEITIVQYECSLEGINGDIIPDEIDGYPVTTIAYGSFRMMPFLESITLPETLVTIEYEAFAGDEGLTSIVIPRSVKEIGYCAFGYDYDPFEDRASKKYSDFTIYGYTGTAAETYANENGFTFIALDDQATTTTVPVATTTTTTTMTTTTESQTQTSTTTPSTLCGDVNLDNDIDLRDVVLLQKYTVEMIDLTGQQQLNGDCNADGLTNAQDAVSLMRFLVQLTDVLPDVVMC